MLKAYHLLPLWLAAGGMSLACVLLVLFKSRSTRTSFRYRAKPIMTANEMEFFQRLIRANPTGYVFPQVSFSALLEPDASRGKRWWAAFRHISQKRVDYAIYTDRLELLCIVELDDCTHDLFRDRKRDAAFASAGIDTVRWQSTNKPDEAQIRARFETLRLADSAPLPKHPVTLPATTAPAS